MNKTAKIFAAIFLMFAVAAPQSYASSYNARAGTRSLLIPGWGQYDNGDFQNRQGKTKSSLMAFVELGGIISTVLVTTLVGFPQAWIGLGILIGNHLWSALDAFTHSKQREPSIQMSAATPFEKVYPAVVR